MERALREALFNNSNKGSDILVDEHKYNYIKQRSSADGKNVYWTYVDPNPGRANRLRARLEDLKEALANYNPAFIKEYMFGLCGYDI